MGLRDRLGRLGGRLRRLEVAAGPRSGPEARARMKAALDELAAARREGRPPSREAREIAEAFEERGRERGA